MNSSALRNYCLSKKGSVEDLPFGDDALVIKVAGKMFALISQEAGVSWINLKCDPALAIHLRQKYPCITPGYHMNKQHWNTVQVDGSLPESEILKMIDHSYDLVTKGLKKADREWLSGLGGSL